MIVYVHTEADTPVVGMAAVHINEEHAESPNVGDIIIAASPQLGGISAEDFNLVVSGTVREHDFVPKLNELQRLVLVRKEPFVEGVFNPDGSPYVEPEDEDDDSA